MPEQNPEIIEALANNEEKLSKLYGLFAANYKEYYNFWSGLSNDELVHAAWLRELNKSFRIGSLRVDESKFHPEAVKLFSDYIGQKISGAQAGGLPMEKALYIALDLEEALIEKKWFTMFEPTSVKDDLILEKLIKTLQTHREQVAGMINEYLKTNKEF